MPPKKLTAMLDLNTPLVNMQNLAHPTRALQWSGHPRLRFRKAEDWTAGV